MTRDQIVIVTQIDDPHADDGIIALERRGYEAIRLNTDDIPGNTRVSMNWAAEGQPFSASIEILTNGRRIEAEQIRSVWWRRPAAFGLPADLSLQEREFATDEIDHMLRGLWASLDCYWLSHPERIRQASWKGEQLRRAAQFGFEVPRTLITTDPDQARDFFAAVAGQMVFKVMTDPYLGAVTMSQKYPQEYLEPYQAMTTLITESELDLMDSVRLVPCLFQEYVPKAVELRVTVIGDELYAAEIHSQENERTALDWRHYDVDIPYAEAKLPAEVADRCLALVRSYGLNFSAIDLILTPDGRYVFVENNPNGQFMFIEQKVPQLAMTDALVGCLIRGANA
ncbi:MAG: MvdC/MvdD family ATP grasp protein [Jatrophihabitantaceae bacterium]